MAATGTACAYCADGMAGAGLECEAIGTCGDGTTTTISTMDAPGGVGVGLGGLECTGIVCALSSAITRAVGGRYDPTGICGAGTITIAVVAGDGAATVVLDITCTADASTTTGLELVGW